MNEVKFWEIVKTLGWGKSYDFNSMRVYLLSKHKNDLEQIKDIAHEKLDNLDNILSKYFREKEISFGGDGFFDLKWHIIGLGEEIYHENCNNPELALQRYLSVDYMECFAYAINFDIDDYSDDKVLFWIEQVLLELKSFFRAPLIYRKRCDKENIYLYCISEDEVDKEFTKKEDLFKYLDNNYEMGSSDDLLDKIPQNQVQQLKQDKNRSIELLELYKNRKSDLSENMDELFEIAKRWEDGKHHRKFLIGASFENLINVIDTINQAKVS